MISLIFLQCLTLNTTPRPLVNYIKNNIKKDLTTLVIDDVKWEKTYFCGNIINKYFKNYNVESYKNLDNDYYGELFKIYGYPSAIVIIDKNNIRVKEFILNKNLIIMFDAGSLLRKTFYKKFKKLQIQNSIGKKCFLII